MMKNDVYFMLTSLFLLKILNLCSDFFDHVEKWLDEKAKFNSRIYDVKDSTTNNYHTHIARYLTKKRQPDNDIWSVNTIYYDKLFL